MHHARKNELNPADGKFGLEGQVSAETCTGHNGNISQCAQKNLYASVQKKDARIKLIASNALENASEAH